MPPRRALFLVYCPSIANRRSIYSGPLAQWFWYRTRDPKCQVRVPPTWRLLSQHGYTFPSGFAPGRGDIRLRRGDDFTTDAMYLGPRRRFLVSFTRSTVQLLFSCMYKMADFPECSSMSAHVLTSRGRISRPDLRRLFPEFGRMSRFFGNRAECPFCWNQSEFPLF